MVGSEYSPDNTLKISIGAIMQNQKNTKISS